MRKPVFLLPPLMCLTLAAHAVRAQPLARPHLERDSCVQSQPNTRNPGRSPARGSHAVAYAGTNAINTLTADPGAYYFLSLPTMPIPIVSSSALRRTSHIDWQGSDPLFPNTAKRLRISRSTNSSGVTTAKLHTRITRLCPFTQVTVTSVNARSPNHLVSKPSRAINRADCVQHLRAPDIGDAIFMWIFRNGQPISAHRAASPRNVR